MRVPAFLSRNAHGATEFFGLPPGRVVELGMRLPPGAKLKGLREKHLLRRALGRHLPAQIVDRPKQPYRAPDSESFIAPAAPDYVQALLSTEAIARAGYFEPRTVRHLAAKCLRPEGSASAADNMAFMAILSTQLLHSHFVGTLI